MTFSDLIRYSHQIKEKARDREGDKKRLKLVHGKSTVRPRKSIGLRNSISSTSRNIMKIMDFLSREQGFGGVRMPAAHTHTHAHTVVHRIYIQRRMTKSKEIGMFSKKREKVGKREGCQPEIK